MTKIESISAVNVNPDVVEACEQLLNRAKAGELVSLCYVAVRGNLFTLSGYVGLSDSRRATMSMGELHTLLTEIGGIEAEQYK